MRILGSRSTFHKIYYVPYSATLLIINTSGYKPKELMYDMATKLHWFPVVIRSSEIENGLMEQLDNFVECARNIVVEAGVLRQKHYLFSLLESLGKKHNTPIYTRKAIARLVKSYFREEENKCTNCLW